MTKFTNSAGSVFSFLLHALRQPIIGFLLCHQWCFSVKVHKGVDGAITETAIKWF